jgi:uncharacterized protein YbaP (TraB family)
MTMTSFTESRIRDHRRNAAMQEEFASAAEQDGKVYMATLYRNIATGHLSACERLEEQLKKMQATSPPPASGDNLLDLGRGSIG